VKQLSRLSRFNETGHTNSRVASEVDFWADL